MRLGTWRLTVLTLAVLVTTLGIASCLGDKGGNGRKGLDHQLDLSAIAPEQGPKHGGTDVLIVGFNFIQDGPVTDVLFGTTPAASFVVDSNNQIEAVTPPHLLGLVDVTVRNADGDEATLQDAFEFTGLPAVCVSLIPERGTEAGGDRITISTSGFVDDFLVDVPLVFFDADPISSVTPIDPTTVEIVTPPSPLPAPHTVDVTVEGTGLPESCTFIDGFTYDPISQTPCMEITPNGGPAAGGQTVVIRSLGPCFWDLPPLPAPTVLFGAVAASNVTVISQTELTCTTPPVPGSATVDVEVITQSCSCLLAGGFTYRAGGLCSITGISPAAGATNGGYPVNVFGMGFDVTGMDVLFGSVYATNVIVISDTQIECTAPPSCAAGVVDVTARSVADPTNSCTIVSGFQYVAPGAGACSISSIVPNTGPQAGGDNVTISGTGFDAGIGVLFGNRPVAQIVLISATQIQVVTPYADFPGPVDVCVTPESSGPCIARDGYTYQ